MYQLLVTSLTKGRVNHIKQEECLPYNEQYKALWGRALTIIITFQSSVKLHHLRLLQYIGSVKWVSGGVEVRRIRFWFNSCRINAGTFFE